MKGSDVGTPKVKFSNHAWIENDTEVAVDEELSGERTENKTVPSPKVPMRSHSDTGAKYLTLNSTGFGTVGSNSIPSSDVTD